MGDYGGVDAAAAGAFSASSTDTLTNKTIDANGTGNSISNIDVADLANGTDGELITWSAAGAATTVAVGTATQVLTSNGAGVAPTFQAAAGGGAVGNTSLIESGTATTTSITFVTTGFTIADTLTSAKQQLVSFVFTDENNVSVAYTYYDIFDGTNYASSGTATPSTDGIAKNTISNASKGQSVIVSGRFSGLSGATTFTLYWRSGNAGWTATILAATAGPKVVASIIEVG